MEPQPLATAAAGEENGDEPIRELLELPAELVGELLALTQPTELSRMRRANKACRDIHVPLAEQIIKQRLDAAFPGRRTLATKTSHTVCVPRGDGAPYSWGRACDNSLFLLGQGQEYGPAAPVPAPMVGLGSVSVREVAAGLGHTLLFGASGGVWSCGSGKHGRLGHGDEADHATPRRVVGLAQLRAVQVAAGNDHSLVLSEDGHVYSFGDGDSGQLGHGDKEKQLQPRQIAPLEHTRICQVSGGAYYSLAVGEEGELYSWGSGVQGQLGLGKRDNELEPVRVALPAGVRIRQASAGWSHSLAVATDGALYSCGYAGFGSLGHGDVAVEWRCVLALVKVLADTPVRSAAAGCAHSVVLTEAGEVLTFGGNNCNGQLGLGDQEKRLVPTAVEALTGKEVVEVAAGDYHTVVRLAGGDVYAFGDNRQGQLGNGEVHQVLWLPTKVALPQPPK